MIHKKLVFNLGTSLFLTFMLPLSQTTAQQLQHTPPAHSRQKKLVKILSIDGGGVHAIFPAYILENLESRLKNGKRLSESFDIIAGTSAGGILALMMSVPDANNRPKFTTSFIAQQIPLFAKKVFQHSFWYHLKSGWGLWDAKYSEKKFKEKLEKYFNNLKFSQLITTVIIPAYELSQYKTVFFNSEQAQNELEKDFYLRDLAYATSAAPTYFRSAKIQNMRGKSFVLVDGSLSTDNPTLAAATFALKKYGYDIDLFVVSLGTGTNYGVKSKNIIFKKLENAGIIGWANYIVSLFLHAEATLVDHEMRILLSHNKPKYYFRIQPTIDLENYDIDDVTPKNIAFLEKNAKEIIQKYDKDLSYIAKILDGEN